MEDFRVVVIGASFAGLNAAITLKKLQPRARITLIDADDCFTMIPALYETAARGENNEEICIPLAHIANKHKLMYFHDSASFIDLKKRVVTTKNGERVPFDYLVIAIGAQTNYYNVEGVDKHALKLKRRQDAERISEHLRVLTAKNAPLEIIVCGGGMSGIQFTAELSDWLRTQGTHSVKLIHAGPRLAQELPEGFSSLIQSSLEKKGVSVSVNTQVAKITKKGVETAQAKHPASIVLWCGGNKPPELLAKTKLPLEKGYISANQFLQSMGDERVFAAGDCAIVNTADGKPAYQTVWNAVLEGRRVGENISLHAQGRPLRPFSASSVPVIFTIGRKYGVLLYKGKAFKGAWVAWLKRFIERFYVRMI